ncbi:hypothetical protein ACJJTC_013671 [Scirpophaga incertulas]
MDIAPAQSSGKNSFRLQYREDLDSRTSWYANISRYCTIAIVIPKNRKSVTVTSLRVVRRAAVNILPLVTFVTGTVSGSRIRRSGRHARVPFTAAQAAALEAAFARAPYLAPPALRALAAALQLRDDRIKIWFQNRRARERREKSSAILPPRDITLPATVIDSHGTLVTAGRSWIQADMHNITNEMTEPYPERDENNKESLIGNSMMTTTPCAITSVLENMEENIALDIETIDD